MDRISGLKSFPRRAQIAPQTVAAAANAVSAYIDIRDVERVMAIVNLGALGGGTVTTSFMQAKDTSGTSAKALTAGDFASVTNAVDNTVREIEANINSSLDAANGFYCVAVKCANAGGTGAILAATLHAVNPDWKA